MRSRCSTSRPSPRARNLGGAILLAAIDRTPAAWMKTSARERGTVSLSPNTPEWQEQYNWAVALADDLNPAWLRKCAGAERGVSGTGNAWHG